MSLSSPGFLCKPAQPLGCRLGWLFYILSELVPLTAVFITVLVLNISITFGAVNGFILFSQLLDTFDIDASGTISYPQSAKHMIQIHLWIFQLGFLRFRASLILYEEKCFSTGHVSTEVHHNLLHTASNCGCHMHLDYE